VKMRPFSLPAAWTACPGAISGAKAQDTPSSRL
jgi:hypothetical protein